jgi:AraC-like DNA-binding protein
MAIKLYTEGSSVTDCAYSCGFADPSHLNKTFKKMFGIYRTFENKK